MTKSHHRGFEGLQRHIRALFHVPDSDGLRADEEGEQCRLEDINRELVLLLLLKADIRMDLNRAIGVEPAKLPAVISDLVPHFELVEAGLELDGESAERVLHGGPSASGQNLHIEVDIGNLFTRDMFSELA